MQQMPAVQPWTEVGNCNGTRRKSACSGTAASTVGLALPSPRRHARSADWMNTGQPAALRLTPCRVASRGDMAMSRPPYTPPS